MKAMMLATAFALFAFTPAAQANGEAPEPPPQAEQGPPQCGEEPCMKTVTKKKVIGYTYKTVKVPIVKKVTKRVPCGGDCQPKVVQQEGVDIPAPKPKVVVQEQQIIVKTVPKVVYAPAPPVQLGPQRPVVYEQPQIVRVAPPPPPPVIRAAPCPGPCPPRQVSMCGPRPCPPPGYGAAPGYGSRVAAGPAQPNWQPSVDCAAMGGTRTINPSTGRPSCFVPGK